MAHQFTDSFCTVTAASQSAYETTSGTLTYSSAYARFSPPSGCIGGGVQFAVNAYARKNLSSNQQTLIAFLSFGALSLPPSGQSAIIVFLDNGTFQCGLQLTPSGALQFVTNITNVGPASAPGLIAASTKPVHGIEIQIKIHSTLGTVDCWLDGRHVITATNLNTQNSANAYANQVQISGQSGQYGGTDEGFYCDYVRVWDNTGSTQNAPVQVDVQPITKIPTGTGVNTQWTPTGFANNWQCVAVIPPSGSDYVSAVSPVTIEDYAVPLAGISVVPNQIVVQSYYQKTSGGTVHYQNGVLSNNVDGVGAVFTANSGLTWVQSCIPLDPHTGLVWTAATADAAHPFHQLAN